MLATLLLVALGAAALPEAQTVWEVTDDLDYATVLRIRHEAAELTQLLGKP